MAVYDSVLEREAVGALIPEEVVGEVLGNVEEESVVMGLATRLPNLSRKQARIPVWTSLPTAYFVNGDRGRKQTTDMSWDNVYLNVEELAVLVPIPDALIDDVDYDIWGQAKGPIRSSIGKAFDQAVLYGVNAPSTWPVNILQGIENADHDVTEGSVGDLYDDLLGEGGVLSKVEEDGFMPNGHVADLGMKAKLRGLRDEDGRPIFVTGLLADGKQSYSLDGEPLLFPRNGAIDRTRARLITGDWKQIVWAVRQDMTFKMFTEGVVTDAAGNILINLMQDDTSVMRVVFRVAWAMPNPINLVNSDPATRYPFASLSPANAS